MRRLMLEVGLVALMGVGLFVLYQWGSGEKAERIREQSNVASLMSSHANQMDVVLNLNREEFKEFKKELIVTIQDSLDIKVKQIANVTTNTYIYTYDSSSAALEPTSDTTFAFKKEFDDCMSIEGRVDISKELIYFDKPMINYQSTSTFYWEKQKKFLFIKWDKQFFQKTFNNCTGDTKIEKITIE